MCKCRDGTLGICHPTLHALAYQNHGGKIEGRQRMSQEGREKDREFAWLGLVLSGWLDNWRSGAECTVQWVAAGSEILQARETGRALCPHLTSAPFSLPPLSSITYLSSLSLNFPLVLPGGQAMHSFISFKSFLFYPLKCMICWWAWSKHLLHYFVHLSHWGGILDNSSLLRCFSSLRFSGIRLCTVLPEYFK